MTEGDLYNLELRLRRLLPESVKAMARLARLALQTPPPPSPEIPQSQLDGARLVTNRIELLRRFPKGGRICELGTDRGNFARQILDIVQPDELRLVDVTLTHCRVDVRQDARAHLHEMTTVSFLRQDKGADFDWIYVDADHSYAAVRRDIEAACPRVKPGGMLAFNDFARITREGFGVFGVHQAVCEFAAHSGWPCLFRPRW
jgi:predicted O-methyltransferase YrrM